MKIALLSGADKNSGDYLIVNRAKEVISARVGRCEFEEFERNVSLRDDLDRINACDVVVFAGGPGYVPDMYPGRFPLVPNLDDIKPKMFALGMGSYLKTGSVEGVVFTDESRKLLDRLESDGFGLGCRDLLTTKLLQANGYDDTVFTGCPAWYDTRYVGDAKLQSDLCAHGVKSLAISDPANMDNVDAAKMLVDGLIDLLQPDHVVFAFHRGWTQDAYTTAGRAREQQGLKEWLECRGVDVRDLSYSCRGFSAYNECDLHVGFRVHAHIYNLSQRIPSVLIEEDGRGWGAVEALGMKSHLDVKPRTRIAHYARTAQRRWIGQCSILSRPSDKDLVKKTTRFVADELENGMPSSLDAVRTMHETYKQMCSHIDLLNRAC